MSSLVGSICRAAVAIPAAVLSVMASGGCSQDPAAVETREATAAECPLGGVAVVVDGDVSALCHGAPGERGPRGPAGDAGPTGSPGADAPVPEPPGPVVTAIRTCQWTDGTVEILVTLWLLEPSGVIGLCRAVSPGVRDTAPLRNSTSCSLKTDGDGSIDLQLAAGFDQITLSGSVEATATCDPLSLEAP